MRGYEWFIVPFVGFFLLVGCCLFLLLFGLFLGIVVLPLSKVARWSMKLRSLSKRGVAMVVLVLVVDGCGWKGEDITRAGTMYDDELWRESKLSFPLTEDSASLVLADSQCYEVVAPFWPWFGGVEYSREEGEKYLDEFKTLTILAGTRLPVRQTVQTDEEWVP